MCAVIAVTMWYRPNPFEGKSERLARSTNRPRIVASLTTTPKRLAHIMPTLVSLLSCPYIDQLYLFLPYVSRTGEEYTDPGVIPGVTIIRTDQDYGPITKLYPLLEHETNPSTIILLCDDDQLYNRDAFVELIEHTMNDPDRAYGYRGVIVDKTQKDPVRLVNQPMDVDVLETYAGVVYRRGFFDNFHLSTPNSPCFFCDDIVIGKHLHGRKIRRTVIQGNEYGEGGPVGAPIKHRNGVASIEPLFEENGSRRNAQCANEMF